MKENIIFILLVAVAIALTWFVRGYLDDQSFALKIADAPSKRTTTTTEERIPQKPQEKQIVNKPKKDKVRETNIDSIFAAGLSHGADSVRALFQFVSAKEETTVTFDSIGTLQHSYDPLTRIAFYGFQPFPRRVTTIHIIDSVFVPKEYNEPWYRIPAYVVGAFAAGYLVKDIAK